MLQSIKVKVLLSFLFIAVMSVISMGGAQYYTQTRMLQTQLQEKSRAALSGILDLAKKGVNGGNSMILNNAAANSLYQSYDKLLYLKIEGMSLGSPKTVFAEAQPPSAVSHEFVREGFDKSQLLQITEGSVMDQGKARLGMWLDMEIQNGGKIYAEFDAPEVKELLHTTITQILVASAVIMALSFLSSFVIGTLVIIKPIHQISVFFEDVQKGDLTHRLPVITDDEIGKLCLGINKVIETLGDIINRIRGNAETLAAATEELTQTAKEIHLTSEDIAKNAESESETLTQNKDVIQRVAQDIQDITMRMENIQDVAAAASQKAANGNQTLHSAMEAIGQIQSSSQKIEGFVRVITEISGQTNLLSLNAAIEAAKAGEFGKGFSVVAEEIRSLADKSQKSVVEIQELIAHSTANVTKGSVIIQETRTQFESITKGIDNLTHEIEQATNQMIHHNRELQEVTSSTEEVAGVSQTNAASATQLNATFEQLNLATEELSRMAEQLIDQVSYFTVRV